MSIASLSSVLKLYRGGEPSAEEERQLVKETLLMTLARATTADTNIQPVEVETVQKVIHNVTGVDVSAADIRVAARAELFETAPLEKCLARVAHKLKPADRVMIARSLAEVINSDVKVTYYEVEFFNKVAKGLEVTPAEVAGLIVD